METRWIFKPVDEQLQSTLADRLRISPILAHILINRGLTDLDAARAFLRPELTGLADPSLLPDIEKAAARILDAVRQGEKIVVYGDYDVDGISGTALLLQCLRLVQANADYYIPERLEEGYGLNLDAIEKLKAAGVKLIITTDCGISGCAEAKAAREAAMDLIISDHHEPGPELPDALAVVNPKIRSSAYPFKDLSGVGVAFKLAWGIAQSFSASKKVSPEFRDFLVNSISLVALGTIADVVPLTGENRIFAKFGLEALQAATSPGLRALLEVSGTPASQVKAGHVAFRLGPRLNAAGRIGDARMAVELLITESASRGREIAEQLDRENRKRQDIEARILAEATEKVRKEVPLDSTHAIVLDHEGWHPGVIGIVASKIVDEFYRPTVLIALDGDLGHGSARSIPRFHLFNGLSQCADRLIAFGGHAQAAGLRIARKDIPWFRQALDQVATEALTKGDLIPELDIDAEVMLAQLSPALVREMERLSPCGQGNPSPLLAATGLKVAGKPQLVGRKGRHVSFHVRQGNTSLKAIAFGMGDSLGELRQDGRALSLAFAPRINSWAGRESVELEVKDIQVA